MGFGIVFLLCITAIIVAAMVCGTFIFVGMIIADALDKREAQEDW